MSQEYEITWNKELSILTQVKYVTCYRLGFAIFADITSLSILKSLDFFFYYSFHKLANTKSKKKSNDTIRKYVTLHKLTDST